MILQYWTLITSDNKYDHEDPNAVNIKIRRDKDDSDYEFRECVAHGIYATVRQFETVVDTNKPEALAVTLLREHIAPVKKQVELNAKAKNSKTVVTNRKNILFGNNHVQAVYEQIMQDNQPVPVPVGFFAQVGVEAPAAPVPLQVNDFMDEEVHVNAN